MTTETDSQTRTQSLPDGSNVTIRPMQADDLEAMVSFARALPQEDLLFLRVDLTDPKVAKQVMLNQSSDSGFVATDEQGIIGYAVVHRNSTNWHRHLGEIRVNVSADYRSRGLGRVLINQAFDKAASLNLKKLTAHMTSDQRGAQAAFRKLGFVPEAHLADYVIDRAGNTRDMIIMSFDLEGHTDQAFGSVSL